MKILVCIDDTDNLESIGTGEVLENLGEEIIAKGWGKPGFITRHQLYIHEDIPYTSHNSSMCFAIDLAEGVFDEFMSFTRLYLAQECAEGSDPGLCVVEIEKLVGEKSLIEWGKLVKTQVVKKAMAYELAESLNGVHLSEHGGTGDGVIGALAGCGLRLSGNDGRLRGKIRPENPQEVMSVGKLCARYAFATARTITGEIISSDDKVIVGEELKGVYLYFQPVLLLTPYENKEKAEWHPCSMKQLKRY